MAAAITANLLGGAVVVATRSVSNAIDPLMLATLRYVIGALMLVPVGFWLSRRGVGRRDRPAVIALGVLIFAIVPYLLNVGLQYTSAVRGAIAMSTFPLFTVLMAASMRIEPVTAQVFGGIGLAMAGVALALLQRDPGRVTEWTWIGDATMLATAALGAAYAVFSRPLLQRYGPLTVTCEAMLAGASALVLTTLALDRMTVPALTAGGWATVMFLGIFGAAVSFWLWSYALRHTVPSHAAITVALNPVTAALLGSMLLHEALTIQTVAGLCLVIAGIVVVSAQRDPGMP